MYGVISSSEKELIVHDLYDGLTESFLSAYSRDDLLQEFDLKTPIALYRKQGVTKKEIDTIISENNDLYIRLESYIDNLKSTIERYKYKGV